MSITQPSILKVVFYLVMVTLTYEVNGDNVRTLRGEYDIFTNINGCRSSKAVCFNDSCTYCQCEVDRTFIQTRGEHGECVLNKLMVHVTCK